MKLRLSRYFAAILGLALIAGFGVAVHSQGTPVANADGFGRAEVTFTKWVTTRPNMVGVVGGDVGNGTYAGEILTQDRTLNNGKLSLTTADYHFNGSKHTSNVRVTLYAWDNQFAVINGAVTSGWGEGAIVYGMFWVIQCPQAATGVCFQGTLYFAGVTP